MKGTTGGRSATPTRWPRNVNRELQLPAKDTPSPPRKRASDPLSPEGSTFRPQDTKTWDRASIEARPVERFSTESRGSEYELEPLDAVSMRSDNNRRQRSGRYLVKSIRSSESAESAYLVMRELAFVTSELHLKMAHEPGEGGTNKSHRSDRSGQPSSRRMQAATSIRADTDLSACFGEILFRRRQELQDPAKRPPYGSGARFACLSNKSEQLGNVFRLLNDGWRLKRPSVLISITGSAYNLRVEPRLESEFSRGLARLASCTSGWVITGGTDAGVMSLVGKALEKPMLDECRPLMAHSSPDE